MYHLLKKVTQIKDDAVNFRSKACYTELKIHPTNLNSNPRPTESKLL